MDINTDKLPVKAKDVNDLVDKQIQQTSDVKVALDFFATKSALEQIDTVEKLVEEKTEELKNDAQAKRTRAETDRINEEAERVKAEKHKEIEEYDKVISAKQKEVEKLKAESDKEQAYFDSNKEILGYIGVKNKKSLGTMKFLMYPATLIFIIVQVLLFPVTFVGKTLEALVSIVGGICGEIKNNALKIFVTILVLLVIAAVVFVTYYFGLKTIK